MSDYRNLPVPLADFGLDLTNPADMVVPGKWQILTNAYPQKSNVITQRKGFSLFFDQGTNAGEIQSLSPTLNNVSFFSTTEANGTVGITDSGVQNFHSLLTGWGEDPPTYVKAQLPFSGFSSASIPYTPPPAPGFGVDTQSWTFVSTKDKHAKFAYPPIVFAGNEYSAFIWGLEPPLIAPTVTLTAAVGGQDSSVSGAIPYTYVYTYFSSLTNAESTPSPVSDEIDSTGFAINVGVTTYSGPFELQYDLIRVYRKGGTQVSTFRLAFTLPMGVIGGTDDQSDIQLSTSLPLREDNYRPFVTTGQQGQTLVGTDLPYIFGPFLGQYIFGLGDLVEPGKVFWTNPGRPDTMDPDNNINITSAQEPLVNGFLYASNPYIFTQQRLFALDYGGPASIPTFVPREVPINVGLAAPFALTVSSLGGVFFLGNDGIYTTDCQGSVESITQDSLKPLFRGEDVGDFPAVEFLDDSGEPNKKIQLFATGQEVHFVYSHRIPFPEEQERIHLVYNILTKSWRKFELGSPQQVTVGAPLAGSEASFLLGTKPDSNVDNTLILEYNNNDADSPLSDNGETFDVHVRTGGFNMEIPQTLKEFGNIIVDIDAGGVGPVTVTPVNSSGGFGVAQTITGLGRQRYPLSLSDEFDYFQAYDFTWSSDTPATLYNIEILFRSDQEILRHWELPPTTFGSAGWFHIRDGYFTVRSNHDIDLVIGVDGVNYSYVIPNTGGQKSKVYVKFRPVKGKIFSFSLDVVEAGAAFRLYGDETQLNIKPWNTNLGYKPIFPFTAPGYAPFLRNEAGT